MRKLISVLLAMALLTGCAVAEITVTPVEPKSRDYSYTFTSASFKAGVKRCLMNDVYEKDLTHETLAADDDVYVALTDLWSLYTPDFTLDMANGKATINHLGLNWTLDAATNTATDGAQTYTFTNALKADGDEILVPVMETVSTLFGEATAVENNYCRIELKYGKMPTVTISEEEMDQRLAGDYTYGHRYVTYTIEDDPDQKVLPVRIYIPASYDPTVANRAILMLHGGSQSGDFFFRDMTSRFGEGYKTTEDFAEEYGFILIAPTAYCKSSDYGEIRIYDETADEEKIAISLLGEKSAIAGLHYAETMVNIDPDHLYLMGQSMGGFGAAWIGNQYKELFDAIVICACIRDIEIYDYPNLVDMPIMFVKGTLDSASGGYEGSVELFHKMNAVLHNMVLVSAEGGEHSYGWAIGMPEWFAFLDAQY